jgi:hypothetical protein
MHKLTAKQEAFCVAMITAASQSDAYRQAYNAKNMNANAIAVSASRLMDNPKISLRVAELRKVEADKAIMQRDEYLRLLTLGARADAGKMFDAMGNPLEIHQLGDAERLIVEGFEFEELFIGKKKDEGGEGKLAAGYTKKFKMTPRLAYLKALGEAQGFNHDPKNKLPLGSDGNPMQHEMIVRFVKAGEEQPAPNTTKVINPDVRFIPAQ